MNSEFRKWVSRVWVAVALWPAAVGAQPLEAVGNRATAMAAFVAVADDASAGLWNPAGLVNGPMFNIIIDFGRLTRQPPESPRRALGSAGSHSPATIAIGVPPLGLTYYRGRFVEVVPIRAADGLDVDRQDRQVGVRSLQMTQVGVSVLQSLADGLTVGTTLKLVRGSVGAGVIHTDQWSSAFDRAETLDASGKTRFDLDAGVLYGPRQVRVGVVARNLAEPEFGVNGDAVGTMRLERHIRAGVAWGSGWPGNTNTIVSFDIDLTRGTTAAGPRRDVAAGFERWLWARRFGLRGGVRASTTDAARPIGSGGVSYAVRTGMYVDAYVARGRVDDRGWGIAARLAY